MSVDQNAKAYWSATLRLLTVQSRVIISLVEAGHFSEPGM